MSRAKQCGLSLLLEDKRIGFKPSLISPEEHEKIEAKLNDPTNGLRGYVELQDWINILIRQPTK